MIRPCYTHRAHSVNMVDKKRDKKGGRRGAEWRGMSRSYLSIQKICWRWGSDRCPFHMLPHAAWVWKEQEGRKEGSLSSCTEQAHTPIHSHIQCNTYQSYCSYITWKQCFKCFRDNLPVKPHQPSILNTHTHMKIQGWWIANSQSKKR